MITVGCTEKKWSVKNCMKTNSGLAIIDLWRSKSSFIYKNLTSGTLAPGEYETAAEIGSSSLRERAYYHIKIHKQILSINYLKTIFLYIRFNFHRPLSSQIKTLSNFYTILMRKMFWSIKEFKTIHIFYRILPNGTNTEFSQNSDLPSRR